MSKIEVNIVTPEEMIEEFKTQVRHFQENKYAYQNGLKDLDFDIDETKLKNLGVTLPFKTIDQAEEALRSGAIRPTLFIEHDETEHQVMAFDAKPVSYSGFMNCVTHSLAITNLGLFEVGRYPAVNLSSSQRNWSWFLHQRLATFDHVKIWREKEQLSFEDLLDEFYKVLIDQPMDSGVST